MSSTTKLAIEQSGEGVKFSIGGTGMGKKLVSIRQMMARSGVTAGTFYCGRSNGSLDLEWVKVDNAVFATEESFVKWLKRREQRLAEQKARAQRVAAARGNWPAQEPVQQP